MTNEELLLEINKNIPSGMIKLDDGKLHWFDEDDSDEADENMWSNYCEVSAYVNTYFPFLEIVGNWQDNDSQGFDLVRRIKPLRLFPLR